MAKDDFTEGQDPFSGTTMEPIDDEVRRQLAARQRSKEERERERELERLRQRQEARRAKKREKDRNRQRVIFDWPGWLIAAIDRIAATEGVSKSQASAFLMRLAVHAYDQGAVDMKPYLKISRSPRWDWELDIPELGQEDRCGNADFTR
jgi:predicted PP-loop superfamily ATPase